MALLLLLLKWLEWKLLLIYNAVEIYVGFIALIFTGLGMWLAIKLSKPKVREVIIEKEIGAKVPGPDPQAIERSGLSTRELEVLALMAAGMSNEEIAGKLFVSLNTVKTHNSNIFSKLGVKRRTQAIERAKTLRLIA
jgi:two-component system, NarL family, response regulator LiaR